MPNVSFQKTINRTLPPGQPGDFYGNAPMVVTAYLAANDLIPGTFACNMNAGTAAVANPKQAGYEVGGTVAGLVTRMTTGVISDMTDAYSNIINAGLNVQIASQGEFKITIAGTVNIGMQLTVADTATGVATAVADGTDGALNWWVTEVIDATAGLYAISSWRKC